MSKKEIKETDALKHYCFPWTIVVVVMITMLMVCLCGCGAQAEVTQIEDSSEENSTLERVEEQTESESVAEDNTIEEQSLENVPEGPQTVGQWAKSLDLTEPKLTIWNDTTKEGIVLENGKEYVVKEGDQLVVCCNNRLETQMTIYSNIIESDLATESYEKFTFLEVPAEPTEVKMVLTQGGVEYVFDVFIVSENTSSDKSEEFEYIDIPRDYETYLLDGANGKIIGYNIPDNWTEETFVVNYASYNIADTRERIVIEANNYFKEIYEGTITERKIDDSDFPMNCSYTLKGTLNTPYGEAKIFDVKVVSSIDTTIFETFYEQALLNVNNKIISIQDEYAGGEKSQENIENIITQMFDK